MKKEYVLFNVAIFIGMYLVLGAYIINNHLNVMIGTELILFIFSMLVSAILFLIVIVIKYFEERKANTIIILNIQKILNYSNKIQEAEKTLQNFKLNAGPFGVPVSIADHIMIISSNIKHTLNFTNSFATISTIDLIQDILEILPELQQILEKMKYANPTSLEQNFNPLWTLFYNKITTFENFIVKKYSNYVINPEKYACKFIKHDLG